MVGEVMNMQLVERRHLPGMASGVGGSQVRWWWDGGVKNMILQKPTKTPSLTFCRRLEVAPMGGMVGEVVNKQLVKGQLLPAMVSGVGGRQVKWQWERCCFCFLVLM